MKKQRAAKDDMAGTRSSAARTPRRRAALLLALVSMCCRAPLDPIPQPKASLASTRFRVVDILVYNGKPDLDSLGMTRGWGTGNLWRPGTDRTSVDETGVREAIRPFKNFSGLFYIDIEEWPVCGASDSTVDQNIVKLSRVADIVRAEAPLLKFGFYSLLPAPGYWPVVGKDSVEFRAWQACNRRLSELARKVDVIFPSLYTYYDDEKGWDVYATAVLEAARDYGKPVYPFLWPEYHESNVALGGKNLPGRVWRHQLQVAQQNASGVVLWNGLKRQWDQDAEWWVETREFLGHLRRGRQ